MKKIYLFYMAFAIASICGAQSIFINEIHYNNVGGDTNEGVEISGPAGTNLAGYQVRFYNSSGVYYPSGGSILNLTGTIPNQQNGLGVIWFTKAPIQNGPRDGMALVDNLGNVLQFLSYGGTVTATEGVANGMTSVNIGVTESESTPVGYSLQLIGTGSNYSDFTWSGPMAATRGQVNSSQTLPVHEFSNTKLVLFPNPARDKLYFSGFKENTMSYEIYNILGAKIQAFKFFDIIDLTSLSDGSYYLKLIENNHVYWHKFVVKK